MALLPIPARFDPLRLPLERIRAADPLLMAAAIAYNFFFALVPLAIAAVAALSTVGRSEEGLTNIEELLREAFPVEVAAFIISLIEEAQDIVGGWQGPVVGLALLIALYSGSRGIYTVQKALRQIERVGEERPWWQVRGLGILFTLAAGIALVGGYVIVLFGGALMDGLARVGLDVGSITGLTVGVLFVWVVLLLFAIYRWGPPVPTDRSLIAAVLATIIIGLMTWAAAFLAPSFGGTTLAALGAVGIVLVWLFALGYVIIVVPALTRPAELVIRGKPE
ncbi:MAG: hypothetical protein BMS9Abin07_0688 [Acidimicrobiia bacterium]|nr:MAG: hypothetical protein BMS9Abin07_0688 [Acidimicrobiia bacterium]